MRDFGGIPIGLAPAFRSRDPQIFGDQPLRCDRISFALPALPMETRRSRRNKMDAHDAAPEAAETSAASACDPPESSAPAGPADRFASQNLVSNGASDGPASGVGERETEQNLEIIRGKAVGGSSTEATNAGSNGSSVRSGEVGEISELIGAMALSTAGQNLAAREATSKERSALPPAESREGDVSVGLVFDEAMGLHKEDGHVECPDRVRSPYALLRKLGLVSRCWSLPVRKATNAELLLAHTQEHIDYVMKAFGEGDQGDGDVFYNQHTSECALLSAGGCISLVEAIVSGDVKRGFALVRPPGHHAECSHAMGFCFYNNVVLAARKALDYPHINRVLVLDWDVHHGNGVQNMLYESPDVMYISLHRGGGFYPRTGNVSDIGSGAGVGYNVNIPWPRRGFGDADYLAAFSVLVEPLCECYQPDLVIVSAGFDAVECDPLGGMNVSPECFGHFTKRMLRFAKGRVALALEGGYHIRHLSESISHCVDALLGGDPPVLDSKSSRSMRPQTGDVLRRVARQLAKHWPVMAKNLVEERLDKFEKGFFGSLV